MRATLSISTIGSLELTLPVRLDVPVPNHIELRRDYGGYVYQGQVAIKPSEFSTKIRTRRGTGRGQTKTFDQLVGPELAAIRLIHSRQMRKLVDEGVAEGRYRSELFEEWDIIVHLPQDEVDRIQRSIAEFAKTHEILFWVNAEPLIPNGNWSEASWMIEYEAKRTQFLNWEYAGRVSMINYCNNQYVNTGDEQWLDRVHELEKLDIMDPRAREIVPYDEYAEFRKTIEA